MLGTSHPYLSLWPKVPWVQGLQKNLLLHLCCTCSPWKQHVLLRQQLPTFTTALGQVPQPWLQFRITRGGLIKYAHSVLTFRNFCLPKLSNSPGLCWSWPHKALWPMLAGSQLAWLTSGRKGLSLAVSTVSFLGQAHSISLLACQFKKLYLILQSN